ncbi:MAG: InlB B-repeat-containing protein [Tannerella sp.]|jgi:M6 family metalloprotease-like protein/uncharacterized repeat protein (TIGR02543 family)|nr:InlB B-repeat-containing protein [Tannerella sp.]
MKKNHVLSLILFIACSWHLHAQNQEFGLTQAALDALAVDPQSWQLQENMTWNDWKPNPVINYEDRADNPIRSNRTIKGMLILVDFPDQPMISGESLNSELIGNPLFNEPDRNKLGRYWVDILNKPGPNNHFVTLNGYFLENSYGDWEIELDACGPYTLSRFEFQYGLGYASSDNDSYQRFTDWFARGSANAEAYQLAKADGIRFFAPNADGSDRDPVYDFVFVLHAGYDQSGAWQELGEMMFQNVKQIHTVPAGQVKHPITGDFLKGVSGYDFSGEARIDRIISIMNTPGFDLKTAWPNFYLFYDHHKELTGYQAKVDKALAEARAIDPTMNANQQNAFKTEFDRVYKTNTYDSIEKNFISEHNKHIMNQLRIKLDSAKFTAHHHPENPHYAFAKTRYIPWSTWYGALGIWSGAGSATDSVPGFPSKSIPLSIQGESDGMGTFAHEFGHLMKLPDNYNNPYDIPRTRSYTGPYELMSRGSFGGPGGNHLRYQIPSTMGSSCPPNQVLRSKIGQGYTTEKEIVDITYTSLLKAPLITEVVARNIPTGKSIRDKAGKEITGNRGIRITGMVDKTLKDNNTFDPDEGSTDNHTSNHLRINPDKWNWGRNVAYTGYTIEVLDRTGYDSFINDHGVMIAKTADSGSTTIFVQDAHPTPLDLIDFVKPDGEVVMISDGDQLQLASALFHAGVHDNPAYFKETYPSKFPSGDSRTGLHGNVANEYVDAFNELHFYVLDKIIHKGKYGDYLSYRIAVRSTAPETQKINGQLTLTAGAFEPASPGRFAVQHFTLKQANHAGGTDIVRIRLLGTHALSGDATVLNNIYALSPGEEIKFAVYIKAVGGALRNFPINQLAVRVSSETNRDNAIQFGKAQARTHTVAFHPNNGSGAMPSSTVYDRENFVIQNNTFTRTGYTVTNWNTAPGGTGTSYIPGSTIHDVTNDISLYAQWTINKYTVAYNANTGERGRGATGIPPDPNIDHGTSYTIKSNTFTREGYTFTGWNTAADGSGTTYQPDDSIPVTLDLTLFAQWKLQTE